MKRQKLEKILIEYGWYFKRHGGSHDIWTNGEATEYIPRHREMNEKLAKKILKTVKNNKII